MKITRPKGSRVRSLPIKIAYDITRVEVSEKKKKRKSNENLALPPLREIAPHPLRKIDLSHLFSDKNGQNE